MLISLSAILSENYATRTRIVLFPFFFNRLTFLLFVSLISDFFLAASLAIVSERLTNKARIIDEQKGKKQQHDNSAIRFVSPNFSFVRVCLFSDLRLANFSLLFYSLSFSRFTIFNRIIFLFIFRICFVVCAFIINHFYASNMFTIFKKTAGRNTKQIDSTQIQKKEKLRRKKKKLK